jgi:hypothetical protein
MSSNVQSSEDEINMYKPDNFELKGGTCFNLKFREPQYKEDYISMRGQHGRGFLILKLYFDENKPKVKVTGRYIGHTKSTYEITSNMMTINVRVSHDAGYCKFSFNVASNNFISPDTDTAENLSNNANDELVIENDVVNTPIDEPNDVIGKNPYIYTDIVQESVTNILLSGEVKNFIGLTSLSLDGTNIRVKPDNTFEISLYVPRNGKTIKITATDTKGNKDSKMLFLERENIQQNLGQTFTSLNPSSTQVKTNDNAVALIIGVSDYKRTSAKAIYADKDARTFYDYALLKLGISEENIKELINENADETEMLLAAQTWLTRSVKQDQTDVYVFFAGHGLASDDGEQMYLLPYDGSPELLDRTAILRDELFSDIARANPRSVTVFLDTCYSGSTRGSEMLIAARPILLKSKESAVPEGFTVFTAAAGDETAKPLEEAKHGMFSYFLMKGMEGDADTNGDKQITAGELHAYVKSNVVQQSSGTQTPELQGDADRVLVKFQ